MSFTGVVRGLQIRGGFNSLSGSIPPFTRAERATIYNKYIVCASGGGYDLLRFRPGSVPRSLYSARCAVC